MEGPCEVPQDHVVRKALFKPGSCCVFVVVVAAFLLCPAFKRHHQGDGGYSTGIRYGGAARGYGWNTAVKSQPARI